LPSDRLRLRGHSPLNPSCRWCWSTRQCCSWPRRHLRGNGSRQCQKSFSMMWNCIAGPCPECRPIQRRWQGAGAGRAKILRDPKQCPESGCLGRLRNQPRHPRSPSNPALLAGRPSDDSEAGHLSGVSEAGGNSGVG
jgi:hypothetical protein